MRFFSPLGWFRGLFAKFRLSVYRKQPLLLLPILFLIALNWRRKDKKSHPQFYRDHGLYVFTGLYGSGKTLSMVRYLQELRQRNPDILVVSNFNVPNSIRLEDVKQVEEMQNPNGIVFLIDEAQLSFNARNYKEFPWEMVSAITQNRKEGKILLFSAQNFYHVDKQIRDLCFRIIHCNSFLGLYFVNKWYTPDTYDMIFNPIIEKRPRSQRTDRFVGYPELFDSFSTYQKLGKIKVNTH